MLLLCAALATWGLARGLRHEGWRGWLLLVASCLVGVFVHRLAALLAVAALWAVALDWLTRRPPEQAAGGRHQEAGAGTRLQAIQAAHPSSAFLKSRAGSGRTTDDAGRKPARFVRRPSSVVHTSTTVQERRTSSPIPRHAGAWALLLAPALVSALLVWAMVGGLGGEQAAGRSAAGAGIPAGPLTALGLTFARFSLDRWPGDAPWWWLLPWAGLAMLGTALTLADLRTSRRRAALALLCLLAIPPGLFLAQLLVTRLYEPRYLIVVYPAWALLLARPALGDRETGRQGDRETGWSGRLVAAVWRALVRLSKPLPGLAASVVPSSGVRLSGAWLLVGMALLTGGLALVQPRLGIFSGDPVKEQYREAISALATRVHPDDAIVLHPGYIQPLYAYYMRRLSSDPAPAPLTFADFWQGETAYGQREWDTERQARLRGYLRSFLLIAPDHARTVDRPQPGDEYGLVGNFWAFTRETARAWPCGIWRYNGAHLLCQEAPEPYYSGVPAPQPATPSGASFGDQLILLGYTLKATTPAGAGVYRAGGTVPISLFWDVRTPPAEDLSLFLHLCQRCDAPPVASEDGPPLEGYLPTSSWLPGKPARDDRAISLPADLPPGRYTLLLGLFHPNDPTPAGRLAVMGPGASGGDRLILGTIEIVAGDE